MAKLALTLTLFIALCVVFTHAKLPLDLPNDGSATIRDPSITLPEPESKRTIMLPSEKPESEPATVVELDLNERETAVVDTGPEVEEMMEEEEENIPIAFTDMRLPVWERGDGGDERRILHFRLFSFLAFFISGVLLQDDPFCATAARIADQYATLRADGTVLTTQSPMPKRYGTLPAEEAAVTARHVEEWSRWMEGTRLWMIMGLRCYRL
uniref:Uncharacterized protein n=1 Tax=Kalanchoe fedtschenkoi TaxID=63787 RepID=A0A7N0U1V3_KALFE